MSRTFPPGPFTPAERAALAASIRACIDPCAASADWLDQNPVPALPLELPRFDAGLGGGLGRVSRGRHGRPTWTSDAGHDRVEALDLYLPEFHRSSP